VSKQILLPPSTTANAIVTGANAELTNTFLQHLSIVAFVSMSHINISAGGATHLPPPCPQTATSPGTAAAPGSGGTGTAAAAWADAVKLSWSDDGSTFSKCTEAIPTNLHDATTPKNILTPQLKIVDGGVRVLRIYPLKWNNTCSCLRFAFHSFTRDDGLRCEVETSRFIDSKQCIGVLKSLRNATEVLAAATDHIAKIKEFAATRRQELAMKKMESIVDEKIAHEQALLGEKLALNSEKSSLEEQLKAAMEQLREMEKTVVREKSYREQLESVRNSLEEEKKELQLSLQEHSEAISETQTQLLKLQATAERDNRHVDILRKKNESDQQMIGILNAELKSVKDEKNLWFADREDLLNQVEVLTEERDDARRNEEELFDDLGERTNDLEKLQESYVNMTDRCNDYQDEICDLQENISSLNALISQGSIFINKGTTSFIPNPVLE
jgi:hypothetical protein